MSWPRLVAHGAFANAREESSREYFAIDNPAGPSCLFRAQCGIREENAEHVLARIKSRDFGKAAASLRTGGTLDPNSNCGR